MFSHFATKQFWEMYHALPPEIRELADKNYLLLKSDPFHPSLHFKKIGSLWSVRIGRNYRALAREKPQGLFWFWIGSHAEYDTLLDNL